MAGFYRDNGLCQAESAGMCVFSALPQIMVRLLSVMGALAMAMLISLSLSFAAAAPAYADELDQQDEAAIGELSDALTEAYEESQDEEKVTGDMASSVDESASTAAVPVDQKAQKNGNTLAKSAAASPIRDFGWVLLGISVAVAAFFLVSTNRLNKSIDKMRSFVD